MKINDVLSREEIEAFTRRSDLAGLGAVAFTWGTIVLLFMVASRFPHPVTFVALVVLLGSRQHALAVLMHEASHMTLCRSRPLNDRIGQWLCAWPIWSDVHRYRTHHIRHHGHTGTPLDPDRDLASPFPVGRASMARKLLRDVLGLSGLRRVAVQFLMDLELLEYTVGGTPGWLPRQSPGRYLRAAVLRLLPPFALNALLFAVLRLTGHTWLFAAWGVAYLTSLGLFLRIRSIAEHAGMATLADPFRNTRTTRAGLLARLLVAPHQVNYHLEHHLLPTAPMRLLPRLHRELRRRGVIPDESVAAGYLKVLSRMSAREAR